MIQMYTSNKRFITFEGIDGCGKTTQARMLYDKLMADGQEVEFVREPGGTSISESIRQILLDNNRQELADRTESLLMTASRAQLTKEIIIPGLDSGHLIIADRYADSTLAYQGGGRKINLEWLIRLNEFATYQLEPAVTFLIDIEAKEGLRRRQSKNDRIEDEGLEFQELVKQGFLKIAERFSARIIVLNGKLSIKELHTQVLKELSKRAIL